MWKVNHECIWDSSKELLLRALPLTALGTPSQKKKKREKSFSRTKTGVEAAIGNNTGNKCSNATLYNLICTMHLCNL